MNSTCRLSNHVISTDLNDNDNEMQQTRVYQNSKLHQTIDENGDKQTMSLVRLSLYIGAADMCTVQQGSCDKT